MTVLTLDSMGIEGQASVLAAEVFDIYSKAEKSLGWFPDSVVKANLKKVGAEIEVWAGERRQWARAGKRPNGSAYSWGTWANHAAVLVSSAAAQASYNAETGNFFVIKNTIAATAVAVAKTAEQTAANVEQLVNVGSWGWAMKLLVALVVLAVAATQLRKLVGR